MNRPSIFTTLIISCQLAGEMREKGEKNTQKERKIKKCCAYFGTSM